MNDLKSCPFCGGKTVHTMKFENFPKAHRFECEKRFTGYNEKICEILSRI